MRRKDREVTDSERIKSIIENCHCCRVGFNDNGEVYIVPLNFGFSQKNNSYIFYFHSACEGRKIDLIDISPNVGFEMDTGYKLIKANTACGYSARFQSVVGNGIAEKVNDIEEKKYGLCAIMKHNTNKNNWSFDEKMLNAVTVFKITVTSMSCKEH